MGVYEALEAWQQGEITYRRALRLLGVDTIADLYDAARSSGVPIRRKPSPAEIHLANRATAIVGRQLDKVVNAADSFLLSGESGMTNGMWEELNKFDRNRFVSSNRLIFSPPWNDEQVEWWRENIFEPHGLYPDDLGELLSASAAGPKAITLLDLNPKANSFVISVKGFPGEIGEVWWHQRSLDLKGQLFRAERMVVPFEQQRKRMGRNFMADLVDTSLKLRLREIAVEAQDIGRYAWARFGFVPDRTAWKYHVQVEARRRLLRSRNEIDPAKFHAYRDVLDCDDPLLIREVVRWTDPVDSLASFDRNGNPEKIAIGKALLLETSATWFGTFNLEDPETMRIFREYVGRDK